MTTVGPGRWVMRGPYGGQRYPWSQCRFCGRAQDGDCRPVNCLLCFTTQCHGNGSGNGCCSVCHYGYLPRWSRSTEQQTCGYAGCGDSAVARAPRVRRVCPAHASRAKTHSAGQSVTLFDYAGQRVVERDAGRPDWARWCWLSDEVVSTLDSPSEVGR